MRSVFPSELEIIFGVTNLSVEENGGNYTITATPPLTEDQTAIATQLLTDGVAEDWVAGPLPEWDNFSAWRYSNDEYIALITGPYGAIATLIEQRLSEGKPNLTIPLMEKLKGFNAVSPTLIGQFMVAADEYNIPQSLIDAWLAVLNPPQA